MVTTFKTTRIILATLAAVALIGNVASAEWSWKPSKIFSLNNTWPFRNKDEPQEGTPTRMVCTWTDTVMSQPGSKPQRGFGGRIMFYEKDDKKPILVDGQLVVYAFDETGRVVTDNKPTRRYVFPVDQMPLHMSKNEFGASYSFFLPWDEAGGPRTDIGLICRFQPTGGAVVASEQTHQVLPGTISAATVDAGKKPPKVPEGVPSSPARATLQTIQAQRAEQQRAQLALYEAPATANPQPYTPDASSNSNGTAARQMTSTTINLPNNFQMPSAAAAMNAQPPAAAPAPPAYPMYQQPMQAQPMPPAAATNPAQTGYVQQAAYYGPHPNAPATPPATVRPPGATYSTTPGGQTPLIQQQTQQLTQQATLQQQLMQQQLLQQQATQQRMLQQQIPVQHSAGQLPMQPMGAATVTYPTTR